jgi:protein-tyrosine kinase
VLHNSDNMTAETGTVRIPSPGELQSIDLDALDLETGHIVGFQGTDIRSRPFNLLRSQIIRKMQANNWKLIGFTSANPAAGKSFLSLNLAAALSRLTDQTVYLFDLDLRRASLAQALGITGDIGMTEYLAGESNDLRAIGRRIGKGNLALFPCFNTVSNSSELLVGARFEKLIAAMRNLPAGSIVICDLPPAFANDDAILITQKLDSYVLVVEHGVTTRKQVKNTIALLQPKPCLGTVLNRYIGGFVDPYGYGDGSYKKYYSE